MTVECEMQVLTDNVNDYCQLARDFARDGQFGEALQQIDRAQEALKKLRALRPHRSDAQRDDIEVL